MSACHEAKNKKGQGKRHVGARLFRSRDLYQQGQVLLLPCSCVGALPPLQCSLQCHLPIHCTACLHRDLQCTHGRHASPCLAAPAAGSVPAHRGKFCLQAFSANNDRVSGVPMTFFFTPSVVCALDGHVTSTKFVGWTRLPGCQKDHRKKRRVLVSDAAARVPREPY